MMRKVLLSIAVLLISSASLHLLQDVEFREGYLLSQGATLRYLLWSPRAEPKGLAVLYHGFGGSSEMMGWIGFELARQGYLVVSYDARGHGKSSSSLSYNLSVLLQDFRLISEKFNYSGEILLIGHSMGGRVVQELAPIVKPSKIVVIASPPSDKGVSSKLLVLAGLDEIFPSSMAKGLSGWHVHISAFDDHLTILYSPNAIEKIVSWISGNSKTTVSLRLALTLISSISAISLLVSLPLAFVGRLEVKNLSEKFISAKFLLILILFAPISFIFLTLFTNVLRAPIASFILGIFYSQALGLLIYRRDLSRVKGIFGEMKPSSLGSAILLALFAYLMMHHALQPFLNVEPSVFRLPLIIELSFLLIPAVLIFETLIPRSYGSIRRNFLQRLILILVSFIAASLILQILVGGGYAGYFLIVTYMSLILLIPIELLASALASRGLALNPIWISIVLGLLLGAVTPIT
jgi:pimeloyl-ACP methyl ester carboxylesterase